MGKHLVGRVKDGGHAEFRPREQTKQLIDAEKLMEHLGDCIDISESKQDARVAEILRNLKDEIETGEYDFVKPVEA